MLITIAKFHIPIMPTSKVITN